MRPCAFRPKGPALFLRRSRETTKRALPSSGQGNRPALPCRPAPFGACRVSRPKGRAHLRKIRPAARFRGAACGANRQDSLSSRLPTFANNRRRHDGKICVVAPHGFAASGPITDLAYSPGSTGGATAPGGSRVKGAKRPRLAGAARSPERARTRARRGAPLMRLEPSTLRAGVQDRRPKAACPAPLPRGERLPSPAGRGAGGSGYGRQHGRKAPRSA